MSYTPGTKLSYANGSERAIILTNEMVMVTMVEGAPWRERMSLADWLILAEGQETVVPSDSKANDAGAIWKAARERIDDEAAAAWANISHAGAMLAAARERMDATTTQSALAAATAAARAAAAPSVEAILAVSPTTTYPERPVGTKLKWVDNETSSTIIVTKKEFLEVKRTPVLYDRPKTSYASEAAWRATLPNSGAVTVTPPKPTLIQEKLAPLPEGLTDIEMMEELERRFNYKPSFIVRHSPKMEVDSYDKAIEEFKEKLALASGDKALEIARRIIQITKYADEVRAKLDAMTEEQQNAQPICVYKGKSSSAILVEVNGVQKLIGSYKTHAGEKYLAYNGGPQGATTFAELGLGASPKLSIVYRKKTYWL